MINICAFTLICSTLVLNVDMHVSTYYSSRVIFQVFSLVFVFNVCQLLLLMFCGASISKGWVRIENLQLIIVSLMIIGQLWIVTFKTSLTFSKHCWCINHIGVSQIFILHSWFWNWKSFQRKTKFGLWRFLLVRICYTF